MPCQNVSSYSFSVKGVGTYISLVKWMLSNRRLGQRYREYNMLIKINKNQFDLFGNFFFFLTPISQILFSFYLVTFLLQSPSSSEVSLWNSVLTIQENIQNYNYIKNKSLFHSNIIFCIQYYHRLFNIWLNNELISSNLFSFIFLWNSFLNNR